jgi:two-component system OmpR family sensor kinase
MMAEPLPVNGASGRGLALLCDIEGAICQVMRDDLGLSPVPGQPFPLLVDRTSMPKALNFLVDLRAQGTALDWEMNVAIGDRGVGLQFAGVRTKNGLFVLGAESNGEILHLYEELMGIHNEQTNALRAALKEKAKLSAGRPTSDAQRTLDTSPAPANAGALPGMYDELSQLNNELANLQRELAQKNAELERLNRIKDRVLGMVAHDLRTPLSVTLGYSGFLLEDLSEILSEDHLNYVSAIRSSCRFMLRLVNSLLDVATIESGELVLDRQPTDLHALVERNVDMNRALAKAKDVRLSYRCEGHIPDMLLDGARIEQVLNNLLSNAIKYSYPQGLVEVHLTRQAGYAHLCVVDHGPGIAPDQLDDLFQWFARSRVRGTAGESGTGLGLAISQKIVEAHLGDIWVESEPGQGSRFFVSLPIKENDS